MALSIHSLSGWPVTGSIANQRTYQGEQGHTVLQLLCDHSPALIESLEEKKNSGALPALLWASPRRDAFVHTRKLDVDCPNPDGDKLWLRAAKGGDYPGATRKLMRAGANIMALDEQGQDALSIMATRQHNKALSVMLDELSPLDKKNSFRVRKSRSKPKPASKQGWKIEKVLGTQDSKGHNALMKSIHADNRLGTFLLTQRPFKINVQDSEGRTPLMQAAQQGNIYAGLRVLGQHAEANLQDQEGKTALMHWLSYDERTKDWTALQPGFVEQTILSLKNRAPDFQVFTEKLLKASAVGYNLQDHQGRTALHYLLTSPNLDSPTGLQALKTLLNGGANPDIQDEQGISPMMLFARHPFRNSGEQATFIPKLLNSPRQVNQTDRTGKTALAHALESGNLTFARQLIGSKGSRVDPAFLLPEEQADVLDPNKQDREGYTALMRLSELDSQKWEPSAWSGLDTIYGVRNPDHYHPFGAIARSLIRCGADLRKTNHAGDTALLIAARRGNLPVVQALGRQSKVIDDWDRRGRSALQIAALSNQPEAVQELCMAGADINRQDIFGKTALQLASEQGHRDVIRTLKQLDGKHNRLGETLRLKSAED